MEGVPDGPPTGLEVAIAQGRRAGLDVELPLEFHPGSAAVIDPRVLDPLGTGEGPRPEDERVEAWLSPVVEPSLDVFPGKGVHPLQPSEGGEIGDGELFLHPGIDPEVALLGRSLSQAMKAGREEEKLGVVHPESLP